MTDINRRGFVKSVAAVVPAAALVRRPGSAPQQSPAPLDDELLRALAEAVLPGELDASTIARVVAEFQTWLDAYEPDAELNHGYGTADIGHTPDDPTARWQSQLMELDEVMQRRFGRSFSSVDAEARRDLLRVWLAGDDTSRLPRPQTAGHVAIGLLASYYGTPEASDLCYGRAIGKNACRPLARSPEEPQLLERDGRDDA